MCVKGLRSHHARARCAPIPEPHEDSSDASFRASYEVDLWGRIASGVSSAESLLNATRFDRELLVWAEPIRARYGAWYEMFPRSAGTDPTRSATFDE